MPILLIMGPTGAGKSSIIRNLTKLDSRFTYIKPWTTRELRDCETDKIHVSEIELIEAEKSGTFVVVNNLYGAKYATPHQPIREALAKNSFPVIDWPVTHLPIMRAAYPGEIVACYIRPESLYAIEQRLNFRDGNLNRLEGAASEWTKLEAGEFDGIVDYYVANKDGAIDETSHEVYLEFLRRFQQ